MHGDLYSGWLPLAGEFPPSLNTDDDPTTVKVHESPECYGVDCAKDGWLKTGSIPTGTARVEPTQSVGGNTYNIYFNRLWRASTTTLYYGSPEYRTIYFPQGLGRLTASATIVEFIPVFGNAMLVATATGSHLISGADDPTGRFEFGSFHQQLSVASAANILTLGGLPFVSNASGVFSMSPNNQIKEWTRPVRDSLSSFGAVAITADYEKGWIIGTAKFVIDTTNEKLFDYGTSGFRFVSRTLAGKNYAPFQVDKIRFVIEHGNTSGGTIGWDTQVEDRDWHEEQRVNVPYQAERYTTVTETISNPERSCERFRVRLRSLSSNIYIREIQVCIGDLTIGSYGA